MRMRLRALGVAVVLTAVTTTAAASGVSGLRTEDLPGPNDPCDSNILVPYVAAGDGVPFGDKDVDGDEGVGPGEERYTERLTKMLVEDNFPYCLYNVSQGDTTSTDDYSTEDVQGFTQKSWAHNLRPRLVTLQIGRENSDIVAHISTCMTFIKNHQFIEANACALAVLGNENAWDDLNDDLADILGEYQTQMDGNPRMVVATLGYYNPYPSATDVATKIPEFCTKLVDTIPTCTIRWVMLPPVLVIMDQITKRMNRTVEGVVKRFQTSSQGHFFFVNPYEKFEDHCMKMEVDVKTKVYHPTNTVDSHDSKKDFGCSDPWIESDGTDGNIPPWHYLPPAINGVLVFTTQTTSGMGAYPNADGHECLAELIYEADNGWGSLKNMLDVPEPPEEPCS